MSIKRQQLFVGLLDKKIWNDEKLCEYFTRLACLDDHQKIIDCQTMSYSETRFIGKFFAFLTFNDSTCVDRSMAQRDQLFNEFGIAIKRLLPDSISKCERLISTSDIVVFLRSEDSSFNEENIRSYFGHYGKIVSLKMLDDDENAACCFLSFATADSSDRVLLDSPHLLNGQNLDIHKYHSPQFVCSLSQFRPIDDENAARIRRWFPIFRNLTDFLPPLRILHKTQLALLQHEKKQRNSLKTAALERVQDELRQLELRSTKLKNEFLQISLLKKRFQQQIDESTNKTKQIQIEFEQQIEEQRRINRTICQETLSQ